MGTSWTIHVVPTEPEFVPSSEQSSSLVAFLAARTGVENGYTVGDRKAKLSIAFIGNKGWMGDPANAREAFRDPEFLPGLERLLGVEVAVVAISS